MSLEATGITWDEAPAALAAKPAIAAHEVAWDDEPQDEMDKHFAAQDAHAKWAKENPTMDAIQRGASLGNTLLNPLADHEKKADLGRVLAGGAVGLPEMAMSSLAALQPTAQNALGAMGGEGAGMVPDTAGVPSTPKDESMVDAAVRSIREAQDRFPDMEARTQEGKDLSAGLSLPFTLAKSAGENVQDRGGSPLAATATETGIDALAMLFGGKRGGGRAAELPKGITPEQVADFMRKNPPEPAVAASSTAPDPKALVAERTVEPSQGDPVSAADTAKVKDLSTMASQAVEPQTLPDAGTPPAGAPPSTNPAPGGAPPPPPEVAQAIKTASGGDKAKAAALIEQATGGKLHGNETPEGLADMALAPQSADVVPVAHSAEAPPPRETPGVDKTTDVPLAGGVTVGTPRAPGHVVIDQHVPQWIKVPEHTNEEGAHFPESWVDQHKEIDEHEKAEFPMLDKLGYQDAHDIHGNAATEAFARRNGMDPKVYMRAQADAVKGAKIKAEQGLASNIDPQLDARPYEDANQTHLLGRPDSVESQSPLPGAPGAGEARVPPSPPSPAPAVPSFDELRAKGKARTTEENAAYTQQLEVREGTADVGGEKIPGLLNSVGRNALEKSGGMKPVRIKSDIDDFKTINDTLGHGVGDQVLKAKAQAYIDAFGEGNVWREGGDEFGAHAATTDEAHAKMAQVRESLSNTELVGLDKDGNPIASRKVGVSYGAGENADAADAALYRDKAARKASGERVGERRAADRGLDQRSEGEGSRELRSAEPQQEVGKSESEHSQAAAGYLRDLSDEIGWDQRGGKLTRAPLEDHAGALGEVTGRSQWVPKSDFWPGYRASDRIPGRKLSESEARAALTKSEKGESLTQREQRFVDYAQREADRRADEYMQAVRHADEDSLAARSDARGVSAEESKAAEAELAKDPTWQQFLDDNKGNPRVQAVIDEAARILKEDSANEATQNSLDQDRQGAAAAEDREKEPASLSDRRSEQEAGDGRAAARAADSAEPDTSDLAKTPFRAPRYQRGAAVVRPLKVPKKAKMPPRRPGESQKDYYHRVSNVGGSAVKKALAVAQRKTGWANFRAMLAEQQRAMDTTDALFAAARKTFEKTPESINLATIDQWETGKPITDVDAKRFFADMSDAFQQRIDRIQAQRPDALQALIANYFPHIYKDPVKASSFFGGAAAKAPLRGDRSFLKQRNWPTLKEAMNSGLEPVSTNPVDLATLKLHQMDKFIAMNDFTDDLRERGWMKRVYGGDPVPEGYARVDDAAFKGNHSFTMPDETTGEPVARSAAWDMVVPEAIAHDINNYLSPSLYRFGAWKALRATENVITSAHLGWSLFHAGFTTLDNAVMLADIGFRKLLRGDFAGGLMDMVSSPVKMLTSPFEGGKLNRYWRGIESADPHTDAVLKMLEVGGRRWKQSLSDYNNALPQIRAKINQLRANGYDFSDKSLKDLLKDGGGALGMALQGVGEVSSWLIHHWLVPNQKMAAQVHLAKYELDRLADAYPQAGFKKGDYAGIVDALHPDTLKQIAGHIIDVIDDRLGHMTYDNWNWLPKMVREVGQGAVQALGWQVGVTRTVLGGAVDLPQIFAPEKFRASLDKDDKVPDANMGRIPMRLTSLITLAVMMGGVNAITQKLLMGEWPSELKDYFFPRTGRRNADDSEERLQYPTYLADHYKVATEPLETAMHKIHPLFGLFTQAFANRDYFGVQIRDEDAPWKEQAKQVAEYVAKGAVLPYSVTNLQKAQENRAGIGQQAASMFGVNVAPASVSRSEFQDFVAKKAAGAMPQKARTAAEAEHSNTLHVVEDQLRHGEVPDGWDKLSAADQKNAAKAADMKVPEIRFLRLGVEDKIRAYDKATPAERTRYNLGQHMPSGKTLSRSKVFQRMPEEEQDAVRARLKEISEAGE